MPGVRSDPERGRELWQLRVDQAVRPCARLGSCAGRAGSASASVYGLERAHGAARQGAARGKEQASRRSRVSTAPSRASGRGGRCPPVPPEFFEALHDSDSLLRPPTRSGPPGECSSLEARMELSDYVAWVFLGRLVSTRADLCFARQSEGYQGPPTSQRPAVRPCRWRPNTLRQRGEECSQMQKYASCFGSWIGMSRSSMRLGRSGGRNEPRGATSRRGACPAI